MIVAMIVYLLTSLSNLSAYNISKLESTNNGWIVGWNEEYKL